MSTSRPMLNRLTPVANRRAHLLMAALMWTVVGLGLSMAGVWWLMQSEGALPWVGAVLALGIGVGKGIFVLRKTARRNVKRIMDRGDGRCIGGFVSWRTWILIGVMMSGGWLLRSSSLPLWILGTIYAGIGIALVTSSSPYWLALREAHATSTPVSQ